jgi:uncharacterized protein (DUF433 family)
MGVTVANGRNHKSLTAQELATAADVPRRHVDHMLETDILPDAVRISGVKRFRCEAALLVALDAHCKDWLTVRARKSVWRSFALRLGASPSASFRHRGNDDGCFDETGYVELLSELAAGPIRLEVAQSFRPIIECTAHRVRSLVEADDRIIADPEILSGTPVIKGTRVPVHDIAASVEAGIPNAEILESFPSLVPNDLEIACIWAKAHPVVGRPRRTQEPTSKRVARKRSA